MILVELIAFPYAISDDQVVIPVPIDINCSERFRGTIFSSGNTAIEGVPEVVNFLRVIQRKEFIGFPQIIPEYDVVECSISIGVQSHRRDRGAKCGGNAAIEECSQVRKRSITMPFVKRIRRL